MTDRELLKHALDVLETATGFTSKRFRDEHPRFLATIRASLATLAPAQPDGAQEDARAAFEAWAVRNWFAIHRNGGEQYVNTATQHAWNGWKGAFEAGAAAPVEGAAQGWISIDERLPEPETPLLYYFEHVGVHAGRMGVGATCGADALFYGQGGFLTGDVTHWMPLPAAPKEKP